MSFFIGIDPGAKGSLCLLDTSTSEIEFHDTPGLTISPTQVLRWLNTRNRTRMIGLEKVSSIRGASAGSNFKFGFNVGAITAIAECSQIGVDLIPPKTWQKGCGIVFKKGTAPAARKRVVAHAAQQLYPMAPLHGPRGGLLDGRADALMIAHYLSIKYGSNS
jgi:hypothetical protein